MAPAAKAPAAVKAGFLDLGFYSGGFVLPEGKYALLFNVCMFAGTKQDGSPAGPERLGVMVDAYPLAGGDPLQQFYSMGTSAHQSFAPDPNTGKSVVPVPGGSGAGLNNQTNWVMLLKSLRDCGMPEGLADLSAVDGVWVQTATVLESEDRKSFGAKTGEAEEEKRTGPRKVAVVSEILEGGKPWEGGGGIPIGAAPAVAKAAPKQAPKPGPQRMAQPAAPVAADEDEVRTAAINGVGGILQKNPAGMTKLKLRTDTFKAVTAAQGPAQDVMGIFDSEDSLNTLLGELGYQIVGMQVKPQE